jgi:hypothetical protein
MFLKTELMVELLVSGVSDHRVVGMGHDCGHRVVGMGHDRDILDVLEKGIGGVNANVEMNYGIVVVLSSII